MKFFAEPLPLRAGGDKKLFMNYHHKRKAIETCRKLYGNSPFILYSYTSFYDEKTWTKILEQK